MSYSQVYGVKFVQKELTELLRDKYQPRAKDSNRPIFGGYLNRSMVEELSLDVTVKLALGVENFKIELRCTGVENSDECVLGVEICRYLLVEIDDDKIKADREKGLSENEIYDELEETTFEHFDEFDRHYYDKYGFKITALNHLKLPEQARYDLVIEMMKKLIGDEKTSTMKPKIYQVESTFFK